MATTAQQLPSTMKAVVLTQTGHPTSNFVLTTIPTPLALAPDQSQALKPTHLLIKVHATGINQVDYKMAQYRILIRDPLPLVLGCDMSGTVLEMGSEVNTGRFKVGDTVFGYTGLGTRGCGTFADYCMIDSRMAMKTSNGNLSKSADELAGCGVGMYTAALGLFQQLALPIPSQHKDSGIPVLIWGASGSVGAFATQMAAAAGYTVIGVCSKRNFDYVKSLGAQHVVDYADHDVVAKIRKLADEKLLYAYSTISTESTNQCIQCLAQDPKSRVTDCAGKASVDPGQVKATSASLGIVPNDEVNTNFVFGIRDQLVRWMDEGKLKPNPTKLLKGMENVVTGLQMVADGKVSGEKVVVVF